MSKSLKLIFASCILIIFMFYFISGNYINNTIPINFAVNADAALQPIVKNEKIVTDANNSALTIKSAQDELNYFTSQSKISKEWLYIHGFDEPRVLAKIKLLLDGRTEPAGQPSNKLYITPSESAINTDNSTPRMSPSERFIHAHLVLGTEHFNGSVIVRWRNLSDRQVIELSSQELPTNQTEIIKLWLFRTQDWQPGNYRLEVFQANQNLQLLASSDFSIIHHGMSLTAFDHPIAIEFNNYK